jgi:hypothetical protein
MFRPLTLALLLTACAQAPGPAPRAPEPPPLSPAEEALAKTLAAQETERWTRESLERWREAVDRGELAEHTRKISQASIESGDAGVAEVFVQGEAMFERAFTEAEGMGTGALGRPRPALSRVENRAMLGGPDARSCGECHARGGDDGHGELHQRPFLDGDGRKLSSAKPRVPPHVAGAGLVQSLAAEMTNELHTIAQHARGYFESAGPNAKPMALKAKGISFGELRGGADGGLDFSGVVGVDTDLVVRPFGWKGVHATLGQFIRAAVPQHLAMEAPLVPGSADGGSPSAEDIDTRSVTADTDHDGVHAEVAESQITALVVYLSLLDTPVMLPPYGATLRAAWERGGARFEAIGCAVCHVPSMPLSSLEWIERAPGRRGSLKLNLRADNQVPPAPEALDISAQVTPVALFSDLKRHDLGPGLAERTESGVPPQVFVTRPLWGLGDRGPYYLHDGRARSLRDAILLHGGEAQAASDAFKALPLAQAREVEVFLLSLRRLPQARVTP